MLSEAGDPGVSFFAVIAGGLEIVRAADGIETRVTVLGPGQFTGGVNMLSGRRPLVRVQAIDAGEMIELAREQLLAVVPTDAGLSEILMRAFILRRANLIARGFGDVVVVGSDHCAGTLHVPELLARNGHPHSFIDLDRDESVQELLDRYHVEAGDVPVVICRGEVVLRNPTNAQVADCLGLNDAIDKSHLRDLASSAPAPRGSRPRCTARLQPDAEVRGAGGDRPQRPERLLRERSNEPEPPALCKQWGISA